MNFKITIKNKTSGSAIRIPQRKIFVLMFILLLTKADNTAKPTYSQHFLSIEVVQM